VCVAVINGFLGCLAHMDGSVEIGFAKRKVYYIESFFVKLAAQHKLPTIYNSRESVDVGGQGYRPLRVADLAAR